MGPSSAHTRIVSWCMVVLHLCQLCAASQCAVGDAACFCKQIQGTWTATPSTIVPTCRKLLASQGTNRVVDIYFPTNIGAPGVIFTPWVHLHGVMLQKWWLESNPNWQQLVKQWPSPMGGNADAWRMNALTGSPLTSEGSKADGSSGLLKQQGYILVVPQGTGNVGEGQMWNSQFWPCMLSTRCIDSSVDDVSFLSNLITNMQQLLPGLPIQPSSALSGYSNGGMMIQTVLCQRPAIAARVSGVALIGTMLGTDFAASSCKQRLPKRLPLMWIHGVKDPVLPYEAGKSMGVSALGAEAGTKLWADRMGCTGASSPPQQVFSDAGAGVKCVNMCGGQQTTAVLCSVANAGHGMWDQPGTGYTAGMALWAFGGFAGQPRSL